DFHVTGVQTCALPILAGIVGEVIYLLRQLVELRRQFLALSSVRRLSAEHQALHLLDDLLDTLDGGQRRLDAADALIDAALSLREDRKSVVEGKVGGLG